MEPIHELSGNKQTWLRFILINTCTQFNQLVLPWKSVKASKPEVCPKQDMALVTVAALGGHILEDPVLMGPGRMTPRHLLESGCKLLLLRGPVPGKPGPTIDCHWAGQHLLFPKQEPVLGTVCLCSTSAAPGSRESRSGFDFHKSHVWTWRRPQTFHRIKLSEVDVETLCLLGKEWMYFLCGRKESESPSPDVKTGKQSSSYPPTLHVFFSGCSDELPRCPQDQAQQQTQSQ